MSKLKIHIEENFRNIENKGLYNKSLEHSACGVGLIANIKGLKSHQIIKQGLETLRNLSHRGACGYDSETGDGAGILIQMPDKFIKRVCEESQIKISNLRQGCYGSGIIFMPKKANLKSEIKNLFEEVSGELNLSVLGWRKVPVDAQAIGDLSKSNMPEIIQIFISDKNFSNSTDFEKKLFVLRKIVENRFNSNNISSDAQKNFYICSLSCRTLIYKGLFTPEQLELFYPDLCQEDLISGFSMVHARFSTNTLGTWKLAHPYRYVVHNGEINTVRGNRNWMKAREASLSKNHLTEYFPELFPICEDDASDTASFDNVFELLTISGRPIEHVMAMMIPEAWYGHETMSQKRKDFYEYHSYSMEPWDGPALMVCTDGLKVGAVLDRNGLRPFRYTVTTDGLLVMSSETGVIDVPPERIEYRSRLAPGRMFLIDFDEGRIIDDQEIKNNLSEKQPYGDWIKEKTTRLDQLNLIPPKIKLEHSLLTNQQIFGYSQEDLRILMGPMAETSKEPVGSMGNDTPLPVLSDRPQNLFSFFKQLFAQVSNPPLDAIREELVTQLFIPLGPRENLLDESKDHCNILTVPNPILTNEEIGKIKMLDQKILKTKTINTLFKISKGADGLRRSLARIKTETINAIKEGYSIIILSDRGVNQENTFIPSLLAVGTVHHFLIKKGLRTKTDLVIESGEPREVHHFAALFGYGASCINPYLALETVSKYSKLSESTNYIKSIEKGLLKIMSKMGISTLQGYQGAQIFEAIGLSQELIDECFTWTPTKSGGIGLDQIFENVASNHLKAFPEITIPDELSLDIGGLYLWKGTGEKHMWDPETISLLQDSTKNNDTNLFEEFEKTANDETENLVTIRGMLEFKVNSSESIPLTEVEPANEIVKRFATGAISLGSISKEAHETLAIAMNRIGARSNTGEGGEDPKRFFKDSNGDSRSSRMKQVASGRFGVTTNYLINATDLQIKMAQGSKPGEGGQIPGHKISSYIASIRKTTPGVELISPPPHHDIYSIEDLAQLIHDLKNVNPNSRIHVKLVAEAGVGIIAAGVAKGKGDVVLISGDSGGTGASPLSSIKHAGLPWELGLAETQQVLVSNGLRGRIVVQTDGQLKTARDIAIATLLGADEWGVATAGLIVLGCIMLRKCHLNTCSVGIATQDPVLRKLFTGTPEAVVNYFMLLSESLRKYMALLGFKTVNDMVGRSDKLKQKNVSKNLGSWDLNRVLFKPKPLSSDTIFHSIIQDHGLDKALDHDLIKYCKSAIETKSPISGSFKIRNSNRTVGAMLSGIVAKRYGEISLPENTITLNFEGSAGQSFGAFLSKGINFNLIGDSNDYFGKGLSGGKLVVKPHPKTTFERNKNIIIGNVALYGATGGEAYINGIAGERFCVRNSAAKSVVEGIGDHGCEYMTGGVVVVLGSTGRNFGAGMSGGVAYIYNKEKNFNIYFNDGMADLEPVTPESEDESNLQQLIKNHAQYTDSIVAKIILDNWKNNLAHFIKVMPRDYAKVIQQNKQLKPQLSETR